MPRCLCSLDTRLFMCRKVAFQYSGFTYYSALCALLTACVLSSPVLSDLRCPVTELLLNDAVQGCCWGRLVEGAEPAVSNCSVDQQQRRKVSLLLGVAHLCHGHRG